MNESEQWLEWLYGQEPQGLIWVGGHADGFAGRTFTSAAAAAEYGMELDARGNGGVYHRLTTMRAVEKGRGTTEDSAYLYAFAADLDLKGPGHKALNYPESEDDLVALLEKAELPEPTAWVHSGGGRYPFWVLEQPIDLSTPGELERAKKVSGELHALIIEWAKDVGWKVDNTRDLARIYRLPGTTNRKDEPITACVLRNDGRKHTLESVERAVRTAARPGVTPAATAAAPESQLFMTTAEAAVVDQPRVYTLSQAMEFVQPALEALRNARDGEINNKLLAAAMTLAHFGEQFWDREAAERQLMSALEHTVYDGATWKAEDTIERAYRDMAGRTGPEYWQAVFRAELVPLPVIPQTEVSQEDKADWLMSQLVTAEELALLPAPVPLVYGVLDMNTESWIIGAPGSFKSFVALDLAAHVGAGREWQGHRVRQGEVIYIAAEGAGGMTLRTRAWQKIHGPMHGVRFLPMPIQVTKAEEWAALVEVCRRIQPSLVIIDTQHRVTAGLEENSNSDFAHYLSAIGAIRAVTGACVLTVHHTGRDGKDARGASAIDGAQDSELKLERIKPRSSMQVRLKDDKQKDMAENDEGTILQLKVVDLGVDPDTERPLSSLVLLPQDQWRGAEIDPDTLDLEPWHGRQPEPWTGQLVPAQAKIKRRILQVLADHAGMTGLTEATARRVVSDRWEKPSDTGWTDAWQGVKDLDAVVNAGGERWALDETALSGLKGS
jgi:hypothetical protein